jgi:hypothetical protein
MSNRHASFFLATCSLLSFASCLESPGRVRDDEGEITGGAEVSYVGGNATKGHGIGARIRLAPPGQERQDERGESWSKAELDGASAAKTGWDPKYGEFVRKEVPVELLETPQARIGGLCSNYSSMKEDDRRAFWAAVFESMSYAESGHVRTTRYVEKGISKPDAVTGQHNTSEGLLQLSYQDALYYQCSFNWAEDRNKQPKDATKTIFDPYRNLDCGMKIMVKQLRRQSLYDTGKKGGYWAVFRLERPGCKKSWGYLKERIKSYCTISSPPACKK